MSAVRPETIALAEPTDNRLRIEAVQTALEKCHRDLAGVNDGALSPASRATLWRAMTSTSEAITWLDRALNHGTDAPIDADFVRHDQALPAPILPNEGNTAS